MNNFALEITFHETGTTHGHWKYCNDVKKEDRIIVNNTFKETVKIPSKEWVKEFVSVGDTVDDEGLWELGQSVIWCKMGTSACGCKVTKTPIKGRLIELKNSNVSLRDRFLQDRS